MPSSRADADHAITWHHVPAAQLNLAGKRAAVIGGTGGLGRRRRPRGLMAPAPETYAARVVPLLVAPEIEPHSGAMFGRNGPAIQRSPTMRPIS